MTGLGSSLFGVPTKTSFKNVTSRLCNFSRLFKLGKCRRNLSGLNYERRPSQERGDKVCCHPLELSRTKNLVILCCFVKDSNEMYACKKHMQSVCFRSLIVLLFCAIAVVALVAYVRYFTNTVCGQH